jgi:hypothetical protein
MVVHSLDNVIEHAQCFYTIMKHVNFGLLCQWFVHLRSSPSGRDMRYKRLLLYWFSIFVSMWIWFFIVIMYKFWCELGFPIFWKVLITLDLVESRHNSIRLLNNSVLNPAIAAPRPLWLSTGVARSTSPRRLSPCLRIENTRKNTKECNQIADEWLISQSWGLINRRRRRNCYQQNNLSKT